VLRDCCHDRGCVPGHAPVVPSIRQCSQTDCCTAFLHGHCFACLLVLVDRGSSSRKPPTQQRPAFSPAPPGTPATNALGSSSSRSAGGLLAACGITQEDLGRVVSTADLQQQLSGAKAGSSPPGGPEVAAGSSKRGKQTSKASAVGPAAGSSSSGGSSVAQSGLLFLDAELLQVADPADQVLLLKGLQVRCCQQDPSLLWCTACLGLGCAGMQHSCWSMCSMQRMQGWHHLAKDVCCHPMTQQNM
jgi:hypothetical protein